MTPAQARSSAIIRAADQQDRTDIWRLVQAFAESFSPHRDVFERSFDQVVTDPATLLLVADEPEHGVVGYLLANSHTSFLSNGAVAWVEEVMVDERVRRSGVGRQLMDRAEEWAGSIGAAYLALASRRAGDFYLALGYDGGYDGAATFYKKAVGT
jgi:GNAT superfamily N-acetyltransferase